MFAALNELVDAVEQHSAEELDVAAVAATHGTTEHHLRRTFSSLSGMPVSEYVRRRRMTVAAADVTESSDDLLTIAVNPQISDEVEIDGAEGSELTYMHGVAVDDGTPTPDGLSALDVVGGSWAVFTTAGPHPQALQETWAATASEWFPSNPWRLRPGPSIVSVLEHDEDFTTATCELWLPVERS